MIIFRIIECFGLSYPLRVSEMHGIYIEPGSLLLLFVTADGQSLATGNVFNVQMIMALRI
jgi:hypothetical protein